MPRRSKTDWLDAGLEALAKQGTSGLTLDAMTTRLGVTTGSFYHHFQNHDDFTTCLLAHWEETATLAVIRAAEVEGTPAQVLDRILRLSLDHAVDPEVAVRAWAMRDEAAREVLARVDQTRLAYGEQLCTAITGHTATGRRMARILYAILIGSGSLQPPLEHAAVWDLIHEFYRLYGVEIEEQ